MRCATHLADPNEFAEVLATSASDYALSQTRGFGEALARAYSEYEYEPRVFDFEDGFRVLMPMVRVRRRLPFLRCYEAMPFSLGGAPLISSPLARSEHLAAILEAMRPDSLLINLGGALGPVWEPLRLSGFLTAIETSTQVLDLESGFDRIWESCFNRKVRNQCRLAERKGVCVRSAAGPEDFEHYYSIYQASTRRWGYAAPPYPRSLFRELAALQGAGVDLKLALVGGQPVAGIMLFEGRQSTLYWSGAMLKEYAAYCPNNALVKAAIEEACRRGRRRFDFGSSGRLEAVRRFKESFGARPIPSPSYLFASRRYRLVGAVRMRMPRLGRPS